mmetsp:Transcript_30070/g.97889  ORF Transcript_30070/g.97889 Transcript_30070/m.97889 type:complete len:236 (+) Transcript_30070:2565-3272(+)
MRRWTCVSIESAGPARSTTGCSPGGWPSRPVSLLDIRFMTATARSLSTSFASPSCPTASRSSRSRAPRSGGDASTLPAAATAAAAAAATAAPPESLPLATSECAADIAAAAASPVTELARPLPGAPSGGPPAPPAPPGPPPAPPASAAAGAVKSLQLMSGSCTNASSIAITESLLLRKTRITLSHVSLKLPSMPLTSMAFTSMRVSRNGTFSGYLSRHIEASKQSPKSMWSTFPE